MRLLEQATFALEKGDRPGARMSVCLHARVRDGSMIYLLRSSLMGLISILRRPMARASVEQRYVCACVYGYNGETEYIAVSASVKKRCACLISAAARV